MSDNIRTLHPNAPKIPPSHYRNLEAFIQARNDIAYVLQIKRLQEKSGVIPSEQAIELMEETNRKLITMLLKISKREEILAEIGFTPLEVRRFEHRQQAIPLDSLSRIQQYMDRYISRHLGD